MRWWLVSVLAFTVGCGMLLTEWRDWGAAIVLLVLLRGGFSYVRTTPAFSRVSGAEGPQAPNEMGQSAIIARRDWVWIVLGIAAIGAAVIILERAQPFFFTQDDSYCQLLPLLVQGARSLFSGVFPQWNPYQFLGAPTSNLGVYCLTYPPAYASYAVARHLLGNEYLAVEVLCVFHLILGFLATFWAARMWGLSAPLAFGAGLSYVLSGYALIVGRSWGNMLNVMAWIPFFFGAIALLVRGPVTWRWMAGAGFAIGCAFHAGFAQIWVYGLVFFGAILGVLVITGEVPLRRSLWAIPALLAGLALAAPLLYVQMRFGADVIRSHMARGIVFDGLLGMLVPGFSPAWDAGTYDFVAPLQIYYFGSLFFVAGACGMFVLLVARWSRRVFAANIWLICAAMALVLAFGDQGYLWALLGKVPWFDKFKHAERFLPLFNLCAIIGGGMTLQRFFTGFKHRHVCETAAAALIAVLIAVHVSVPPRSYYSFLDPPYPSLAESMRRKLTPANPETPHRIISFMPMYSVPIRTPYIGYSLGLEQNFPTVHGILAVHGYDPLVWHHSIFQRYVATRLRPNTVEAVNLQQQIVLEWRNRPEVCAAYGVRWMVLPRCFFEYFRSLCPELATVEDGLPAYVKELDGALPLAFAESAPGKAYPVHFDSRGAQVDLETLPDGGPFIVNILAWPEFRVYADGHRIPFSPDEWGRMRVDVPPNTRVLDARYSPAWETGLLWGVALGVICVAAALLIMRLNTRDRRTAHPLFGRRPPAPQSGPHDPYR